MRIRRKTWARPELSACPYFIAQPEQQKGRWGEVYGQQRPLHLDLGCGKCVFLAEAAHTHRDVNFIGIDISLDILGVARRNIAEIFGEEQPDNVPIISSACPSCFLPKRRSSGSISISATRGPLPGTTSAVSPTPGSCCSISLCWHLAGRSGLKPTTMTCTLRPSGI